MAKDSSFDVVSQVDTQEVLNAVHQSKKEMEQRFDFRGSKSSMDYDEKGGTITLVGDDDFKLRNVIDILEGKLAKRGVSVRALEYGSVEPAAQGTVRQVATLRQGISQATAKDITKLVRDSKLKVQASIQGDQVRIAGAKKDDLQAVIALLKGHDFDIDLQFINYR